MTLSSPPRISPGKGSEVSEHVPPLTPAPPVAISEGLLPLTLGRPFDTLPPEPPGIYFKSPGAALCQIPYRNEQAAWP